MTQLRGTALVTGVGLLLVAGNVGAATEAGRRKPDGKIAAKKTVGECQKAVKQRELNDAKIVSRLIGIADNKREDVEERIAAVLLLGKLGTGEAIAYLLKNVTKPLAKKHFGRANDHAKQKPYLFALHRMDWGAIPHILEFAEAHRTDEELHHLAGALEGICGKDIAVAILTKKKKEAKKGYRKNIKKLLSVLESGVDYKKLFPKVLLLPLPAGVRTQAVHEMDPEAVKRLKKELDELAKEMEKEAAKAAKKRSKK